MIIYCLSHQRAVVKYVDAVVKDGDDDVAFIEAANAVVNCNF